MREGGSPLFAVLVLLVTSVVGCSGGRTVAREVEDVPPVAVARTARDLRPSTPRVSQSDSPQVFPSSFRVYPRSTQPESVPVSGYDMDHTILDLAFNFAQRSVAGTAIHSLAVTADSLKNLPFHAFGLTIQTARVTLDGVEHDATWTISGQRLEVDAPVTLRKGDSVLVELAYVAYPYRTAVKKGLYFVDPDGSDPSLPTQMWTIGQPEDNRIWFPTWDYPNDRMTFDINLNVPDSLVSISSSELVDSVENSDGTRTDRWVMDTPQPAYLVAIAVGDFVEMQDEYVSPVGRRVPLSYFGEPQFGDLLDLIYGITPDVLQVLERKTAIAYPFNNLKQVAVREFTAGGMENSTAIFYDHRLQHDERANLDYTGRDLIVHEVAHQWFGDFITCRSWAHLPLNEGFANFFEQVYLEEIGEADKAQEHRISDRHEYLAEAAHFRRPIIWTEYTDPNLLFDSHSYEKSELVLNALRFEIGEDAFWRGVRLYLASSEDGTVTLSNLKEAMERSVRRPLGTFFDQWFLEPGHPELVVQHGYDEGFGLYEVRVRQTQDTSTFPTYKMDAVIELNYESGAVYKERVRISSADTTFRFGVAGRISFVRFDEGGHLLADIRERKDINQWLRQAIDDDEMAGRYDAVAVLGNAEPDVNIKRILLDVAEFDEYDWVRAEALTALEQYANDPAVVRLARQSSLDDESARCRRAAVRLLTATRDASGISVLRRALQDPSYYVAAEAATGYAALVPNNYMDAFGPVLAIRSWENIVEHEILEIVSGKPDPRAEAYVLRQMDSSNAVDLRISAIRALAAFATLSPEWKDRVRVTLRGLTTDDHAAIRSEASRLERQL